MIVVTFDSSVNLVNVLLVFFLLTTTLDDLELLYVQIFAEFRASWHV